MRPDLLSKYARPVPRYTSYPTAPHFRPDIDGERYRAWLGELGEIGPLSLYIHIPFCRSLCWFCGCATRVVNHYGPVDLYLDWLLKEIELVAEAAGARKPVSHVHFGGGTPTMLSAHDLARLFEALARHFAIAADADFAVEIDPRVLSREQAKTLGRIGVNRASIGVQDFAPDVQKAINRIQPYGVTARAVEWLRASGVLSINLDLIYGLPHQTVGGVVSTVERAVGLDPDRLAVFGYAHVPWMKKHQRLIPEAALPGPEMRQAQAEAATAAVLARGYVAIGLDHFARPEDALAQAFAAGTLARNFQGYTTDRATALIGLGASAIGTLPAGYAQNTPEIRAYGEAVAEGRFAIQRGIAIDEDDRLRHAVIQRLMCGYEAPLAELCLSHGFAPHILDRECAALAPMAADGIVALEDGVLRVTELGRPLVRAVCAVFDSYLAAGEAHHSIAV